MLFYEYNKCEREYDRLFSLLLMWRMWIVDCGVFFFNESV